MDIDEFECETRDWIRQHPGELFSLIPPGSGICRIVNVPWDRYNVGFLSKRPGRWTNDGNGYRYFANDMAVCEAELGYFGAASPVPPDQVVELWETVDQLNAVSIYQLPAHLQAALFEDKGDPAIKWAKPHALLRILRATPEYADAEFIHAPSASGVACNIGGNCLVVPGSRSVRPVASGTYLEWQEGRVRRI